MKIKFGIVRFPGSNCDFDSYRVAKEILSVDAEFLWHKERNLKNSDVIILPGGFSYGDYIRTGSIARFSPIMEEVIKFANIGGIVLGICNGFQILLEAGLLPGVMLKNKSLKFISKDVYVHVENKNTIFTSELKKDILKIPIAHAEGNYFADDEVLKRLEEEGRILFKYSSSDGTIAEGYNPNGSKSNIAGIINKNGNVLGMMPHPERCSDILLGNDDGLGIFLSILKNVSK
jgi:phosphoribosylformylglycinamidine synthase